MSNELSKENKDSFSLASNGSRLTTVYLERKINVYGITDAEMDKISFLNTLSILFYSIGSFFLSPLLDILQSVSTANQLRLPSIDILFFVLAVFFYILGSIAIFMKRGGTKKIRKESKVL